MALTTGQPATVELPSDMTTNASTRNFTANFATNFAANDTNNITINQAGDYEINYSANIKSTNSATISLIIRRNGVNINSAILTNTFNDGESFIYSGSIITPLAAFDIIDMVIVSTEAATGVIRNATLSAKLLN